MSPTLAPTPWHQLTAAPSSRSHANMKTCSQARKHFHTLTHTFFAVQSNTLTWIAFAHPPLSPSHHRRRRYHSLLCSGLMSCWLTPSFSLRCAEKKHRPGISTCVNSNWACHLDWGEGVGVEIRQKRKFKRDPSLCHCWHRRLCCSMRRVAGAGFDCLFPSACAASLGRSFIVRDG